MALLYGTKAPPVSDAHHLLKNLASRNHGAHRKEPRNEPSSVPSVGVSVLSVILLHNELSHFTAPD
jgi:hypothetical protein